MTETVGTPAAATVNLMFVENSTDAGSITLTGITYGGQAMTQVGATQVIVSQQLSKWVLLAPPAGAQTVTVTFTDDPAFPGTTVNGVGNSMTYTSGGTITTGTLQTGSGASSPITKAVANVAATSVLDTMGGVNDAASAAITITVNGTVVTFVASGATGNQLNITDNISTLLAKIDSITGTAIPSTISGGAITLHSGTAADLSVSSSNSTAFAALGFAGTAVAVRGVGTVGTGQVTGNDNSTFLDESVAGGAVTAYDVSGSPVDLQPRWAKTDSASLGAGHTDNWNLFYQVNPNATGTNVAWQNVNTNFTFSASGQMSPRQQPNER